MAVIKCDKSWISYIKKTDIAVIARNYNNKAINGAANPRFYALSSRLTEALAICLGAYVATRNQWSETIIESNYRGLISSLKFGQCNYGRSQAMEIQMLLIVEQINVYFISTLRSCTRIANSVEKSTYLSSCLMD